METSTKKVAWGREISKSGRLPLDASRPDGSIRHVAPRRLATTDKRCTIKLCRALRHVFIINLQERKWEGSFAKSAPQLQLWGISCAGGRPSLSLDSILNAFDLMERWGASGMVVNQSQALGATQLTKFAWYSRSVALAALQRLLKTRSSYKEVILVWRSWISSWEGNFLINSATFWGIVLSRWENWGRSISRWWETSKFRWISLPRVSKGKHDRNEDNQAIGPISKLRRNPKPPRRRGKLSLVIKCWLRGVSNILVFRISLRCRKFYG